MSGGVDSAVALLKAGPSAVGVTLRLWIDPRGPDADRACCSPAAVIAARETCHARGIPHVTLDLREEFRRAVVEPFVRGYARGETPNPCVRCNGSFRFDELLAFADRIGAARLATGHYARIVERDGRPLLARAVDAAKDQSYMLATLDPTLLGRLWFPLGEQTKARDACARPQPRGSQPPRAPESQEACFLGGDDYRAFLGRAGLAGSAGPLVDEAGRELGTPRRLLALHAGPAPRARRRGARAAVRARAPTRARTRSSSGRARALARRRVSVRGRLDAGRDAGRGQASLPLAGGAATVVPTAARLRARSSTSRPTASRPARPPSSTRTTPSSAPASSPSAAAGAKICTRGCSSRSRR